MSKTHRHERSSWIICGGYAEWCFTCGAWRRLVPISANESKVYGKWFKPSGDPKDNPAMREPPVLPKENKVP